MHGWVVRAVPDKGFILVQLEGYEGGKPAILHIRQMTAELREDLRNNMVKVDEELLVEVSRVDPREPRIELRELPEPAAESALAA
jgi:ribosomal protein S1